MRTFREKGRESVSGIGALKAHPFAASHGSALSTASFKLLEAVDASGVKGTPT